jgi:hypothetical protein
MPRRSSWRKGSGGPDISRQSFALAPRMGRYSRRFDPLGFTFVETLAAFVSGMEFLGFDCSDW